MLYNILKVLILLQVYTVVQSIGYYSIVAPGTIRPNSLYNVELSVQEATEPCSVKVTILGPKFEKEQQVNVEPQSVQNVEFKIPDIRSGTYTLKAEGVSGLIFSNSTELNFVDNKPAIHVQTDKATYKPGDLVQFRVIFLDENIRPASVDKPIVVFIKDAAQNRVKQYTNVTLTKGVFSNKMQLSQFPLLGEWSIEVQVEGEQVAKKSVDVDKYVLPKFEVIIEAPKKISVKDEKFGFTVRSKYTFGKAVKGRLFTRVKSEDRSVFHSIRPIPYRGTPSFQKYPFTPQPVSHIKEKSVDFNGKEYLMFDIKDFLPDGLQGSNSAKLDVFVSIEEELTGNMRNSSKTVEVVRNSFNINAPNIEVECPNSDKKFQYNVTVKNLADEPVIDEKNPVILTLNSQNIGSQNRYELLLNQNGLANVQLSCAEENLKSLTVTYKEETAYGSIRKKQTKSSNSDNKIEEDTVLSIKILTEKPVLGQNVKVRVQSNEQLTFFIYTVVARGNIVESKLMKLPNGYDKSTELEIKTTFEMVPTAKIYVHFVKDGTLKFFETSFNLEKKFQNPISIDAPRQAKPGEKVVLTVTTDPESYIGLSAVDQSVLLLKTGNDFEKDKILSTLEKELSTTPQKYLDTVEHNQYPGSKSGVITLTNAHFPYKKRPHIRPLPFPMPRVGGSPAHIVPYSAPAYAFQLSAKSFHSPTTPQTPLPPPRLRKEFPESWFFEDFSSFDGYTLQVPKRVPDTITSWVVTAFSLNPQTGFALTDAPSKIQTFRPFFIATNLPYSIKRGESVAIPIIIFNYMDQDVVAEVTMDNTDKEFEFTDSKDDQLKRIKRVSVSSNNGETVMFSIRPKHIGYVSLKISAISPLAGDAIQKELKVEPEGVTVYRNRDYYLHGKEGDHFSNFVTLDIPSDIVPDSEYIEVSVMGDILGSTITNLDKLVRMPSGCGEQNMINFVPNILVLRYLESIHQISPSIEEKAKQFMEIGYQRELTYKHDDGSYSAFGKSDAAGSTWLTAYVMKSFHQAAKYIDIDPKVLDEGLQFLANKQAANGSFLELGKVLDFSHQNEVGLTAFVLLAFLENNEFVNKYVDVVDRGFKYLEENVKATDDLYAISVAVYALQLHNSKVVKDILDKLDVMARIDGGHKWWSKAVAEVRTDQAWRPKSHDVEVTAYILLTLLEKDDSVLPITKWLISQRNSNGGFDSTQETVVGLQALIKFAEKSGSAQPALNIKVTSEGGSHEPHIFAVQKDNALVLQTLKLQNTARNITFNGTGAGTAILQVSYRYNILKKDDKPSFKLSTKTQPKSSSAKLFMDVCAEFLPADSEQIKSSNMVVLEVSLPSGYMTDVDALDKIKDVKDVKRVETKNGDTVVIVYFDSLKESEVECVPIEAERIHEVTEQKPTPIVIYDYYDNQKRATEFY